MKYDDLDAERMPKTVKRRDDMAKKYGIGKHSSKSVNAFDIE